MLPDCLENILHGALLHVSRTLVSTLVFDVSERQSYL